MIKLTLFLILVATNTLAASYSYTNNQDIIGKVRTVQAKENDTMAAIARRYNVGMDELILINNNINPYMLLPGTVIILPTKFILPKVKRQGLVINLPEKRMYFFRKNKVLSFPVGIGKLGWATPLGNMRVISKVKNPTWVIPKAVWQEQFDYGNVLPKQIPPGPDNPLGKYYLRLSKSNYLIHGTHEPSGVGQRVSAGCIRMYPEDIKLLYKIVPINTPVTIINQPLKYSARNNQLAIESHPPLNEVIDDRNIEDGSDTSLPLTLAQAVDFALDLIDDAGMESIEASTIYNIINSSLGIPMVIAKK